MENLGKWSGTTEASIKDRMQAMEESISGVKDMIEEIDTSVKENAKSKKFLTQNIQEIWGIMKNAEPKDNCNWRRSPAQRHAKYIQQNQRRKLSQSKEGHTYENIRSLQNTK